MRTSKYMKLIHWLSYLQYPFIILGVYYSCRNHFVEDSNFYENINNALIFLGIGLSFTSLSDLDKIGGITRKILTHKKWSKYYIIYLLVLIAALFGVGFYSMIQKKGESFEEVAVGFLVLGIGAINMLKMSMEIINKNK